MIEVLANIVLEQGQKRQIDGIEAFLQKKNTKQLEIIKGEIKQVSEHERTGVAIRTLIDNKMSFIATNATGNIEEFVELGEQLAQTSSFKVSSGFHSKKQITPIADIQDNLLRDVTLEEAATRVYDIISSVTTTTDLERIDGSLFLQAEERLIANSEGLWKREVGTKIKSSVTTAIDLGEYVGLGTNKMISRGFTNNWQELFDGAIETAKAQAGRRACTSNKIKHCLLSHQVVAKLLAYGLVPSFLVSNNLYQNNLLANITFHENIILLDDPTFPGGQNSFGFDDEGYPTKPRILVTKNKIKRLLGMNFQCQTLHSNNKYRGNCYRTQYLKKDYRDYSYPPQISASNFVLKARKSDNDLLLSNITDGLYIKDIVGFQDIDHNTGDFVVSIVEGYRIYNSELRHPILPCFCAGNIYSILKEPTLLLGSELKEIDIEGAPLSVIAPELVTNQIKITD